MQDCAPFARAAINATDSPDSVPPVVIQFAITALDVIKDRAEFEVLNDYCRKSIELGIESTLVVQTPIIHALFEEFVSESE